MLIMMIMIVMMMIILRVDTEKSAGEIPAPKIFSS
jgi:hypothetical protein